MASDEVSREIHLARHHRRLLLPVRLTAAMPQGGQAYHLGTIQWLEGQGLKLPVLLDHLEGRIRALLEQGPEKDLASTPTPPIHRSTIPRRTLQALVALIVLAAVACDLTPWNGPNQWLLDQRLFFQARWRQLTNQSGPPPAPIGLLQLSLPAYERLGVQPTADSVNQAVLAQALEALPATGPPQRVGLDFILDGPGSNLEGHQALAEAIHKQQGLRLIVAGLCPPNSIATADCLKAVDQRLAASLAAAGAKAVTLGLGMSTTSKPPLQLAEMVGNGSLAWAMATVAPRGGIPPDALIDWSVNWLSPKRLTLLNTRKGLAAYRGESLLIASDGYKGQRLREVADQHPSPLAVWAYNGQGPQRFATSLQRGGLPGGALQAVLAQSINSGHWLEPVVPLMPTTLSTVLLTAASSLAARRDPGRRQLKVWLGLGGFLYILVALQLVVSLRMLLPIALPLSAAAATVLSQLRIRIKP